MMSLSFLLFLLSFQAFSATKSAVVSLFAEEVSFLSLSQDYTPNIRHTTQVISKGDLYQACVLQSVYGHTYTTNVRAQQNYVWSAKPNEIASFTGKVDDNPFNVKLFGVLNPKDLTHTIITTHNDTVQLLLAAYKPQDMAHTTPHDVTLTYYLKANFAQEESCTSNTDFKFFVPFFQSKTGFTTTLRFSATPPTITATINEKVFLLSDLSKANLRTTTPTPPQKVACWTFLPKIKGDPGGTALLVIHNTFKSLVLTQNIDDVKITLQITIDNAVIWRQTQTTTLAVYEYTQKKGGKTISQSILRISGVISNTAYGVIRENVFEPDEIPALLCAVTYSTSDGIRFTSHHIGPVEKYYSSGKRVSQTAGFLCQTHFSQQKPIDNSSIRVLLPLPHDNPDGRLSLVLQSRLRAPNTLYISHGTKHTHTNLVNFNFLSKRLNFLKAKSKPHQSGCSKEDHATPQEASLPKKERVQTHRSQKAALQKPAATKSDAISTDKTPARLKKTTSAQKTSRGASVAPPPSRKMSLHLYKRL